LINPLVTDASESAEGGGAGFPVCKNVSLKLCCVDSVLLFSCFKGVGCVLLTSDNQIVLLKRSGECAEAPLLYDVPGGHPEPGVSETIPEETLVL